MAFSFFRKSSSDNKSNAPAGYRNLVIREIIQETPDAIRVVFEKPELPFTYQAGQFITLILTIEGREERRSYSLCSSPVLDDFPAIGIKRVEKGKVSGWCIANLRAGQSVRIMDPAGSFTLPVDSKASRYIALVAGGSGITPMLALLRTLLDVESGSMVSLIYANRSESSMMFRQVLDETQLLHPKRLKVFHVLDQLTGAPGYLQGPVSSGTMDAVFQDWTASGWNLPSTYMLCGPEPMMHAVTTLLNARGVAAEQIRRESFTPSAAPKPAVGNDGPHDVILRYDGQEFRITVQPNETILETALNQGIDLPFSCRSGMCTACRGKAVSGKVRLDEEDGLSKSERDEGYVLTCVGHPMTDDVVIEIG